MKNKIPLKAGDFVIFAAIIALACGIWIRLALMQTDQTYGEILVDGELYRQIKLGGTEQETIAFEGRTGEVTIEIDGDRMRMFSVAECRRAMGFPEDYWLPERTKDAIHMLGNAVVPQVAADVINALREAA